MQLKFLLIIFICLNFKTFSEERPNVLFIIVDDLNDLTLHPQGKPEVATPHLDALAKSGVNFTNAHCNDPICAPSRTSMLFGLYPQTTGLYWFESWKSRNIFKRAKTMPEHFQAQGYKTFGTGKIFHGRGDMKGIGSFGMRQSFGPHPVAGMDKFMDHHSDQDDLFKAFPDLPYKWEQTFGSLKNIPDWSHEAKGKSGWYLYGKPWKYNDDEDRDLMPDELSVQWCKEVLEIDHDKPFMLFAGLVRTHTPLYAPQKYFDKFPLEKIKLPAILEGDLKDCAGPLADQGRYGFLRYQFLRQGEDKERLLKQWIQAYMACVSFIDDQVGELMKALHQSQYADNTIVVFTSDHGFHMGDKEFLYKQSLWDGATKVPFIVSGVNGMKRGGVCHHPVSLIDIFPSLNDLCGLSEAPNYEGLSLDGHSIKPFLFDPDTTKWSGPSVAITALPGKDHMQFRDYKGAMRPHFSVRSQNYRYTLCSNGEEELYDFKKDPYEWYNLASHPEYKTKLEELKKQLLELRDGKKWKSIDASSTIELDYQNYELEFEVRSSNEKWPITLGSKVELPKADNLKSWNHYRVMVDGNRIETWINNQWHSDEKIKGQFEGAFQLKQASGFEIKNLKVKKI